MSSHNEAQEGAKRELSPEGLWNLAGGNAPGWGDRTRLRPGGAMESGTSGVRVPPPLRGGIALMADVPGALPPAKFHWPSGPMRHFRHVSHPRFLRYPRAIPSCAFLRLFVAHPA
jgi:hypothetical protein